MAELKSYLVKVRKDLPRGDPDAYALYFCRQEKGCERSRFAREQSKQPCGNCLRGEEHLTLEELQKRLERGDA